jgi:hypothetical protein
MRAWIDRTNDGLSGMPADGINLPVKKGDFGTSRWAGSKVRLHRRRHRAEGGMTACGTIPAVPTATKDAWSRLESGGVARGLPECEQRIVELEQEIDQLQRTEETIVVATGAPREPGCPAVSGLTNSRCLRRPAGAP